MRFGLDMRESLQVFQEKLAAVSPQTIIRETSALPNLRQSRRHCT
jgi:hypothetical protein